MYQCTVLVYYTIEGATKLKVNAKHGKYATPNPNSANYPILCTFYAKLTETGDQPKTAENCKDIRKKPQGQTDDETVRNIFVKFKNTFRHGL